MHYFRSTDVTISTTDTAVGTDAISALDASRARAESIRLTAPSIAGTYYYGDCVDPVSGESLSGNNCSAGLQVTVSGGREQRKYTENLLNDTWFRRQDPAGQSGRDGRRDHRHRIAARDKRLGSGCGRGQDLLDEIQRMDPAGEPGRNGSPGPYHRTRQAGRLGPGPRAFQCSVATAE